MKGNKQPILSICIPTWNRRYSLQYTLKSIIEQDEFNSGDVEIVISDNASTDETEIEVKKLTNKFRNIKYYKNKKNIGGPANINKAFSLGKGKYLWMIGSDSKIINGGIENTINIIKKINPDIIYNNCIFTTSFKHFKNNYNNVHYFKGTKDFLIHLGNQYNYDKNSFLYLEYIITFISCICISNTFYKNAIKTISLNISKEQFNRNYFSQELICFSNNADKGIILTNNNYIDRYTIKKTSYFVNRKIIKDFHYLSNFIKQKYSINNKNFEKFIIRSKFFWFKSFIIGKLIKILINLKIYRTLSHLYRKYIIKNLVNTEGDFFKEIDKI